MTDSHAAIFCDFDGTVSKRDIGYQLYHHFSGGRNDALLPDWKAGRLTTRDCLEMEAAMVRASSEEILSFLDQFELDDTFIEFERVCRANSIPLMIVSEGLDFYIKRLLLAHGLDDLPVYCNIGHLENGGLRVEFPYRVRTCDGCGNCKAARIAEYRRTANDSGQVIFIGDGYSDACGANEADMVFAKKDLVRYCRDEGISYHRFSNFNDVTSRLLQIGLFASNTKPKI